MEKLRIKETIVVEGRYDAIKLADIVDAPILTTGGFAVFKDKEKQLLLRHLGQAHGIILLTDADNAGFQIRKFITDIVGEKYVRHAYIPAVIGKERRKTHASKERTLGVEGIPSHIIRKALMQAGATSRPQREGREITYTDLFEWGLSGGQGSADARRNLLQRIGLPPRLSKKALCQVLNTMYTYEEFCTVLQEKPVLFWDFHGTLTEPDQIWYLATQEICQEYFPEKAIAFEAIRNAFHHSTLPWWNPVNRVGCELCSPDQWWNQFQTQLEETFAQLGLSFPQCQLVAKEIHTRIVQSHRHRLKPDAEFVLQEFQRRGFRQYLLSNNFPETIQVVQHLGIAPYFSGMIVSALVGYDKPQKEIFALALEQAGNPEKAYMIGDNPTDDLKGCKQVNMIAVGVGRASDSFNADISANSLTELLDKIP